MSAVPLSKPNDDTVTPATPAKPKQPTKAATSSTKATAPKPKTPTKTVEVDPTKLSPEKLRDRVAKIYALEKVRDRKKAALDLASRGRRAAKAELEQAEEDLTKEIQEQRFGPGPLFNPDGSGPAGKPQADESGKS